MCTNKKLILLSACFALTVQALPLAALHAQTACEVQQMRLVPANRQTAMPNKKGQGVSNKKGQDVPQMRLAKTALAAPVARPMTSATTATATRLLSSTYSYVSDSQSANDNFDYTYTYDKNGLPTSVVGTDGLRRDYEFTLNAQGYWTQRTVSSSKNGTPVSTVQTRRTYDDQNRVTSEAEYTINSAGTDFVLTSKNVYSYDNGADGYRSSHTVYNALGAETSIEQTLWFNAVGGYVTNLWSYPYNRTTIEVDNGQNTCTLYTYSSPEGVALESYTTTKYSLLTDDHYVETESMTSRYEGDGNVSKSGVATEVALDPSTNEVTEKPYSVVYVGGTAMRTPQAWRKCSLNEYLNLPVTEANGNRHSVCYDAESNCVVRSYTCEWVGNSIAKVHRSAAGAPDSTAYLRYDAAGKCEGEVCFCADGSFTVADNSRRESLQDYKDNAVYISLYDARGTLQRELKCLSSASDEYLNTYSPRLVIKDGDAWTAAANTTVSYSTDDGRRCDMSTDALGRVTAIRSTRLVEGATTPSYLTRSVYSYTADGKVREVAYRYSDAHDADSEMLTHCRETEQSSKGPVVVYYSDESFTTMTAKEVYDISAHCTTRWNYMGRAWLLSSVDALTEGHFDGDIFVFTTSEKDQDGNIVPVKRQEKMMYGPENWCRDYTWDAAKGEFVGSTGGTMTATAAREFTCVDPFPHEESYDSFWSMVATPIRVCGEGDRQVDIVFEWDSESGGWLMTKEGYRVSDDGLTCSYVYEDNEGMQTVEYVRNADGRLVSYSGTMSFGGITFFNEQTYTYDSEGRLVAHVKRNERPGFDSTISYSYRYGEVEVSGIDAASADMAARVTVEGRTFCLSGVALSLYDAVGRLVTRGNGSVTAPSAGVYLLKAEGQTVKVVVR